MKLYYYRTVVRNFGDDLLERLRAVGARFIVFAQLAFWWLDFYAEFGAYIRSSYRLVLNGDRLIAFSLNPQTKPGDMTGTAARS